MQGFLWFAFFTFAVASQAPPPPQNVQVEKGQLTWTPGEPDVTYTVNYRR